MTPVTRRAAPAGQDQRQDCRGHQRHHQRNDQGCFHPPVSDSRAARSLARGPGAGTAQPRGGVVLRLEI